MEVKIDFDKMVAEDAAAKVISALSEEERKNIVKQFVLYKLNDVGKEIRWAITRKLEEDATEYAMQYIVTDKAQAILKTKAVEAVEVYFDKVAEAIPKEIEKLFKSKYYSVFEEK